jgi:hypothetical protein
MKTRRNITTLVLGAVLLTAPVAASAAEYYGAFAFSQKTGAAGWSKNYSSQAEAEGAALQVCFTENKAANDCKVSYTFADQCAALAVGGDNGWGADWGVNLQAAENKALHTCAGYSYNCKILMSQCSNGQ